MISIYRKEMKDVHKIYMNQRKMCSNSKVNLALNIANVSLYVHSKEKYA